MISELLLASALNAPCKNPKMQEYVNQKDYAPKPVVNKEVIPKAKPVSLVRRIVKLVIPWERVR